MGSPLVIKIIWVPLKENALTGGLWGAYPEVLRALVEKSYFLSCLVILIGRFGKRSQKLLKGCDFQMAYNKAGQNYDFLTFVPKTSG